jgi:hypothetical protein
VSQQHWVRDNDGDIVEITSRVQFLGDNNGIDGFVQHAEEGTTGKSTMRVDDEDSTFTVRGHRIIFSKETAAAADDFGGVFGVGYTGVRDVEAGHPWDGLGRVWSIEIDDINTVLARRKLLTDAKRPAETDVARAQWIFNRPELLSAITDDTYLSTADPVQMSKADYTKQSPADVLDDIAQQSGKNWYVMNITDAFTFSLWYGHDALDTFTADVRISNHPDDLAEPDVYAPADGTKISIDPTRIASGVIVDHDKGYVYRTRPATATDFAIGGRDLTMWAPNVKTRDEAIARAERYLVDLSTEEYTIATGIVVDAADVNIVRQGHRIQARLTWSDDGGGWFWTRILARTVRPLSPGPTGARYEIAMELAVLGPVPAPSPCEGGIYDLTEAGYYPPMGSETTAADGVIYYARPGTPAPFVPTPGHVGQWNFPVFGVGDGGSINGTVDTNISALNTVVVMVVGDGTLTFHTRDIHARGATVTALDTLVDPAVVLGSAPADTDLILEITGHDDCLSRIEFSTSGGSGGGSGTENNTGFDGITWAPA